MDRHKERWMNIPKEKITGGQIDRLVYIYVDRYVGKQTNIHVRDVSVSKKASQLISKTS